MDRERGEEACETMVTLAEPRKHEHELEIEEVPMSTCEEPVRVGADQSDDVAGSDGGNYDRGGDARKAATSRSTRPRARAMRSRVRVWYTCKYCASETKFESLAELHEHETKEHPSEVVPAKA